MGLLILGLGNSILGDDAVGLVVAEAVRGRVASMPDVEVDTDCLGGLHLMERLVGYDRAVIIDALCSGQHAAGAVVRLRPGDLQTQNSASTHDMNLVTALQLAATIGLSVPREIDIIAIEAQDTLDFADHLSPAVAAAVPRAVEAVIAIVTQGAGTLTKG